MKEFNLAVKTYRNRSDMMILSGISRPKIKKSREIYVLQIVKLDRT